MYEYNGESYKFYSIILDTKEFFVVKEKYFSVAMSKIRFFGGKIIKIITMIIKNIVKIRFYLLFIETRVIKLCYGITIYLDIKLMVYRKYDICFYIIL